MFAPIALFAYCRPDALRHTLNALSQNFGAENSDIVIFSDGWKKSSDAEAVIAVREIARSAQGFKSVEVVERPHNMGLAASVIDGVSSILKNSETVIVVEDDIITSPNFLRYMNEALERYQNARQVFSVTGYNYPASRLSFPNSYTHDTYFSYRCHSWTWATWKDCWELVDWGIADADKFFYDAKAQKQFSRGGDDLVGMLGLQLDGTIDSWAIRFCYAHFRNNAYCLYPRQSLVKNFGFGDQATHCKGDDFDLYVSDIIPDWHPEYYPEIIAVDEEIAANFKRLFGSTTLHSNVFRRIKRFTNQFFRKVGIVK